MECVVNVVYGECSVCGAWGVVRVGAGRACPQRNVYGFSRCGHAQTASYPCSITLLAVRVRLVDS